ncbi:unnamed protein product [Absidia cylindrospora]
MSKKNRPTFFFSHFFFHDTTQACSIPRRPHTILSKRYYNNNNNYAQLRTDPKVAAQYIQATSNTAPEYLDDFILIPDFISDNEHVTITQHCEKKLKRSLGRNAPYETGHFDGVISGYRECSASGWMTTQGSVVAGLCLKSPAKMVLEHVDDPSCQVAIFLPPRCFYIQRDTVRYQFKHAVMGPDASIWHGNPFEKTDRISLMFRNTKESKS